MRSEYVVGTKKDLKINYEYSRISEYSKNSPSHFNNRYGLVLCQSCFIHQCLQDWWQQLFLFTLDDWDFQYCLDISCLVNMNSEISVFFSGTALLIGFDIINLNYCIYFRLVCFSLWRNEISFKLLTFTLLERKKRGVLPETNELFLNFNKSQIFALRCMLLVLDLHIFHIHYHKKILFTNTFCSHFCFHSGMLCKSRSALSCTDTFHMRRCLMNCKTSWENQKILFKE